MSYKNLLIGFFAAGLSLSAPFANALERVQNRCICHVSLNPRACYASGCNADVTMDLVYTNSMTGQIEAKQLFRDFIGRYDVVPREEERLICNRRLQQIADICEVSPLRADEY